MTKKRPLIIIVIVLMLALSISGYYLHTRKPQSTTEHKTVVSSAKTYTSVKEVESDHGGLPHKVITGKLPNISISWYQGSVVDDKNTCTIYDSTTYQLFASEYQTSGNNEKGVSDIGSTYYNNPWFSQDEGQALLTKYCYHE